MAPSGKPRIGEVAFTEDAPGRCCASLQKCVIGWTERVAGWMMERGEGVCVVAVSQILAVRMVQGHPALQGGESPLRPAPCITSPPPPPFPLPF